MNKDERNRNDFWAVTYLFAGDLTTTKKKPVVKKPASKSKAYIKGKEALKRLRKRN